MPIHREARCGWTVRFPALGSHGDAGFLLTRERAEDAFHMH